MGALVDSRGFPPSQGASLGQAPTGAPWTQGNGGIGCDSSRIKKAPPSYPAILPKSPVVCPWWAVLDLLDLPFLM